MICLMKQNGDYGKTCAETRADSPCNRNKILALGRAEISAQAEIRHVIRCALLWRGGLSLRSLR